MSIKKDNCALQITISKELNDYLNAICDKSNISKSKYITALIINHYAMLQSVKKRD